MQLLGLAPWILLSVLLVLFAARLRTAIVGWILVFAGIAVFAVRLHHEGPYPFPSAMDLTSGCVALGIGALLIRSPWSGPREGGVSWITRALLGLSPIVFFLAFVAYGHEAEEVVVLRTTGSEGAVRETRLWVVEYEGAPWIVTSRGSAHDADLTANPQVEIFRRGAALCWIAERHVDRTTIETLLQARSDKYRAQRIAFAIGAWKHFSEWGNLEEIAVALRFTPCP
jgi:hypothetical protein